MFQLSYVRIASSSSPGCHRLPFPPHFTALNSLPPPLSVSPGLGPFLGAPRHLRCVSSSPLVSINQSKYYLPSREAEISMFRMI